MQDLGTLGGFYSYGSALNDSGLVTGYAETADSRQHAFLWNGIGMVDLGTLGGHASRGNGINSSGFVTGASDVIPFNQEKNAFVWDGNVMIDLNTVVLNGSGWDLNEGLDINDAGQITGRGFFNGQERAFLLTPVPGSTSEVPEPATLALLSGAAICLVGRRRWALKR